MASDLSSENDVDGDDEREEDDDEEEEEEGDEAVEEEEEPRLKYQRMGGSVPSLLSTDAAASIAIAERMIALGTHDGTVHILDFQGNQVKEFSAHNATVNDLCFDAEGEYVGSCSDDGSVVINGLFTDERLKFEYHRPMKSIALDPDYSRKSTRRFVAGGLAGQLFLNSKTWLGYNKQVLHDGEGPIHAVKWRTCLIAWANDAGVKVYDMVNNVRVTFIERPYGIPRPELLLPRLVWQDDSLLVIGWGTSVKIAAIRTSSPGVNGVQKNIPASSAKYVDIVASFQTSYSISGIAPFGDALVVLAYIPENVNGEKDFHSTMPSRQGTAQRPEVRIVTWKNEELTTDALPVHGFEHYKAKDYTLAHAPFTGSSYAGGQWAAGDEPLYYIVSPKDVVIARPRDAEDHIAWLLQHGFHEKALAAVEAGQGRNELLDEVGSRYLDHLIVERKYAEAASLCPKLLRGSASAWERWVFHFAHLRQLPVLVSYMPTENPQLSDTAYEVALVALATNPSFHNVLLATVRSWPPTIYSSLPIISAIESQLSTYSTTNLLKEALAELYVINCQYEKALALYADLLKPEIFDFIEKNNLHDAIHGMVVQLMMLDSKRAVLLLIHHRDIILPFEVVEQLLNVHESYDTKYFLHLYLHSLFEIDVNAGKEYHDLQVELYADYEPRMLLTFLRISQHYKLDKAYDTCVRKGLLREQAFILGRMGNAKKALAVIIDKLENIEEAVEFVSTQQDDELWQELIRQCLRKPEMVGMLLDHTVGNLDPLYIVTTVPNGLKVPRLRDRLVKIITDYRTETSLRKGCNEILKADCVNLLIKYYKEAQRAVCMGSTEEEKHAKVEESSSTQESRRGSNAMSVELKSRTRGSGRCCLCFDPFSIQNVSVVVFFCCHAYHLTCLTGGSDSVYMESRVVNSDDDEDEDAPSGGSRIRCVLCTTAAG
ncbi:vacuolar protein sorting-associated protein 41 homolog [Phalaenopsis equestris]|uniref:vacuolar protein sorting-associated protein 41 homolog n=1 Tax=Phalaenopsis equestris TaxID=78828 RepID=UPI0009E4E3D5|nr:vacuolar protein sorting-associated protein 41 homolog [Phalaenopsis equestris]XP_020596718.1 vacuolar protein sorting-associated protein 41 homolog [Phalaenopsis equestris]XP_020596719.1 vacuolar protein sorting-associated protein 41 homolog [Phalaenopsis equestris]